MLGYPHLTGVAVSFRSSFLVLLVRVVAKWSNHLVGHLFVVCVEILVATDLGHYPIRKICTIIEYTIVGLLVSAVVAFSTPIDVAIDNGQVVS
jgi:hypothetical protein